MKHFRILVPLLVLVLLLSACTASRQPYDAAIDSSGSYGVEVTKEERAASTFVAGVFFLLFGLYQCFF